MLASNRTSSYSGSELYNGANQLITNSHVVIGTMKHQQTENHRQMRDTSNLLRNIISNKMSRSIINGSSSQVAIRAKNSYNSAI